LAFNCSTQQLKTFQIILNHILEKLYKSSSLTDSKVDHQTAQSADKGKIREMEQPNRPCKRSIKFNSTSESGQDSKDVATLAWVIKPERLNALEILQHQDSITSIKGK